MLDLIQLESGKARRARVRGGRRRRAVSAALRPRGRRLPRAAAAAGAFPVLTRAVELRHPKGVVGIISPWNYPLSLALTDALPALLAGNAVVLQARQPDGADRAAGGRAAGGGGLPERVLQVVLGAGPRSARPSSTSADYVCFTGSTATGRAVAEQCRRAAGRLLASSSAARTRCSSLRDADLDRAAEGAVRACFSNAGQLCVSIERMFVPRTSPTSSSTAFVRARPGDAAGRRPGLRRRHGLADLRGPARRGHRARRGRPRQGRQVLDRRPARPDLGPYFYEPTVLEGVTADMTCFGDETFGPVVSVYRVPRRGRGGRPRQRRRLRPQRLDLDPGRRPRAPAGRAGAGRHGQRQRGVRRGLGAASTRRWAAWRVRARPAAGRRGHPQVHRGADRRDPAADRLRRAAVGSPTST